jgi:mono/diheme cytochrome c family protein
MLDRATEATRPRWQRVALLRGVDLGLGGGPEGPGRRRGGGPGRLALPHEPRSLTRLAEGSDELAAVARGVVPRLDWPGRPAPVAEIPPLTPAETARFEAGREVYANLCVACHQPDGAGGELAPSLVGSPLVVGRAGIPTRVVLGGKEGDVGLMPPLGSLTDEEIAAVLTYVRREWGNAADPVRPEDVTEIRGLTAVRTHPWTREELLAVRP